MNALSMCESPELAQLEAASGVAASPGRGQRLVEPHDLACRDGRRLSAAWCRPATGPVRAVAVLCPATGVPQTFYRPFAHWLAGRGYAVLTFDYRGIGASRTRPLHTETAAMRDWALHDMTAAVAAGRVESDTAGGVPLLAVGHSFGGNAIGLVEGLDGVDAVLAVASQSGEWRLWPAPHRWVTWAFFHALVPGIAHGFGHLPAWALGGRGEPLPKLAALEWARWGRRRGFLFSDPTLAPRTGGYASYRGDVHLWDISDDPTFGPAAAVDALAGRFTQARVQRHTLTPAQLGVRRLGHFGPFRRQAGPAAWRLLLAPIESANPALRGAGLDGD